MKPGSTAPPSSVSEIPSFFTGWPGVKTWTDCLTGLTTQATIGVRWQRGEAFKIFCGETGRLYGYDARSFLVPTDAGSKGRQPIIIEERNTRRVIQSRGRRRA